MLYKITFVKYELNKTEQELVLLHVYRYICMYIYRDRYQDHFQKYRKKRLKLLLLKNLGQEILSSIPSHTTAVTLRLGHIRIPARLARFCSQCILQGVNNDIRG